MSSITLSGVDLRLELPEHIFAGQTVRARVELENEKMTLPSFSLRVEAATKKKMLAPAMLETPIYFPYLPKHERVQQSVPIYFHPPRARIARTHFESSRDFHLDFCRRRAAYELGAEALVYPSVEPTREFLEILPGAARRAGKSHQGRWSRSIRAARLRSDRQRAARALESVGALRLADGARIHPRRRLPRVCWCSIRTSRRRCSASPSTTAVVAAERFERAVTLCASIAWHFYERNAQLQFRSAAMETSLAAADENIFAILKHLALAAPLPADPQHELLSDLAASPGLFKMIVTSQPRGSIPAILWHSSYVVFLDDLDP